MLEFNRGRIAELAQQATDEMLMDRVTVYRAGMEPAAVDVFERELRRRGVTQLQIETHAAVRRQSAIMLPDGTARQCSFCERPAIAERRGWFRFFRVIPVFPRHLAVCAEHQVRKL